MSTTKLLYKLSLAMLTFVACFSLVTSRAFAAPPSSVATNTQTSLNSYYVTLNGQANPNSLATAGHFRVFTSNPGSCGQDSGGTRYPALQSNDVAVTPTDNSVHAFSFTIPFNSASYLLPNTTYWYCAYAINSNGTTGASGIVSFTTPDGPASPCDPPSSGNHTIPVGAACVFPGFNTGVDAGTGTRNTALISLSSGANLTVNTGQNVAFGGMSAVKGSSIVMAKGSTLRGGGLFVHDKDRDGVLDSKTQYVGSTASAEIEFVRRNTISATYNYGWKIASSGATLDCDNNNSTIFRIVPVPVVVDADNDGYKTSAAASTTACVGEASTINGRTYFQNSSGDYTLLAASQVLGGGATDCTDSSIAPCPPTSVEATPNGSEQMDISWSAGVGPAATSYNLQWCSGASCTPSTTITGVTSVYNHTGRTCETVYGYRIIAVNASGSSTASSTSYDTTGSCGLPAGVILAWPSTNGSIPAGYTRVTAADGRWIKSTTGSSGGSTGGSLSHTHPLAAHTHTANHNHSNTTTGSSGTTGTAASGISSGMGSHTHSISYTGATINTGAVSTANSVATDLNPPYYEMILIQSDGTQQVPSGAVMWFNGSAPSGWTTHASSNSRPVKAPVAGGNGGGTSAGGTHTHSLSHTHSSTSHAHDRSIGNSSAPPAVSGGSGSVGTFSFAHGHTVASTTTNSTSVSFGTTAPTSNAIQEGFPGYRLRPITPSSGGVEAPVGGIAMWNSTAASIPSGWVRCNGASSTPNMSSHFLIGSTTTGAVAGSFDHAHSTNQSHTHTLNAHTHTNPALNSTNSTTTRGSGASISLVGTHTHTVGSTGARDNTATGSDTISANTSSNVMPPYYEVIFICKQ